MTTPSHPSVAASRPAVLLESDSAGDRRLRVRFTWRDDRFAHEIDLVERTGTDLLMISCEGQSDVDFPLSPPLQQLHVEERAKGMRVALLVGMAGKNHWSMSVEAAADGKALLFDVACRRNAFGLPLTSIYRLGEDRNCPVNIVDGGFEAASGRWEFRTIFAGTEQPARLFVDDGCLTVTPHESTSRTARWKYRIDLRA